MHTVGQAKTPLPPLNCSPKQEDVWILSPSQMRMILIQPNTYDILHLTLKVCVITSNTLGMVCLTLQLCLVGWQGIANA
jgi:hypothetical protein